MSEIKNSVEVKVVYKVEGDDKTTEVYLDGVKKFVSSDSIEGNGWELNDVSVPLIKALNLKGNIYSNLKDIEGNITREKDTDNSITLEDSLLLGAEVEEVPTE